MYEIIPGILEKEWSEIERKIELIKPFARTIHIDIIDGKFASNTTFLDPTPFAKYSSEIFFEVHLMVEEPINYLKSFAASGFKRFIGHIEDMSDQAEFVAQGQLLGEAGLAVDSPTSIDSIKVPLEDLDCLTIMTVKAGESGQKFIPKCLEKIKILKRVQDDTKAGIKIEVDGGINDKTIIEAIKAGANRFVATSFLFNAEDPKKQYEMLKQVQHDT